MSAIRKVGIVGLGRMGTPMGRHLAAKGYSVSGCDPAEAARSSDLVLVVVGFDSEVETAVFGADGIAEAAPSDLVPWAEKDMAIVLQEADAARLSLPLCGAVRETIKGLKIRLGLGLPQSSS